MKKAGINYPCKQEMVTLSENGKEQPAPPVIRRKGTIVSESKAVIRNGKRKRKGNRVPKEQR